MFARRPDGKGVRWRVRRLLGWPARRLLDRRVEWLLAGLNYRGDRLEGELRLVSETLGEVLLDRRLARLQSGAELALPADTARFLNWAQGPEGPAARAGLWFNPPVPVRYEPDAVEVLLVNERIVEQPYVFGTLGRLRPPARILDVGGSESTIALSLAGLGHEVHVVDPRGYPVPHPSLTAWAVPLERLEGTRRFDAALAVSALEHFGLGVYGQPARGDERMDQVALGLIRERLAPGGLLVLTVPCAASPSVDEFQRVYSLQQVREMLSAWELVDLSVVWRHDRLTWVRGAAEEPPGEAGVALVTARRPA